MLLLLLFSYCSNFFSMLAISTYGHHSTLPMIARNDKNKKRLAALTGAVAITLLVASIAVIGAAQPSYQQQYYPVHLQLVVAAAAVET
jgi:hypothetical protein